jgi:hypothetical protein
MVLRRRCYCLEGESASNKTSGIWHSGVFSVFCLFSLVEAHQVWLLQKICLKNFASACHDSFWLIQVLARESYSKQKSYIRHNFSRPNRTYTNLDLFQSGRIPRYHCIWSSKNIIIKRFIAFLKDLNSTSIWNKKKLTNQWKQSIIVPIRKKGDKTDYSKYCAISTLWTSHNIFSNNLLSKLNP